MDRFNELARVEEEKHLMPNLSILAKALFGENSYLLKCQPEHSDWATDQVKRADGFVWLPWRSQLWIVEVEWKEGSNFFQQSRAFAKSKVNWEKLSHELREHLRDFEPALNRAAADVMKEDLLVSRIIGQTRQNHYEDGYLKPHCWVLLGHDGDNSERLRETYEEELKGRFTGSQQYLLTMTRVFQGNTASYALLTQYPSMGCSGLLAIGKSILVPMKMNPSTQRESGVPESWQQSAQVPVGRVAGERQLALAGCEGICTYFDLIDAQKQKRISKNILDRDALWRVFVSKGQMTSGEFKRLSRFEPRAIAGFMRFLTDNGIASRFGETFRLNDGAVAHIKGLLDA